VSRSILPDREKTMLLSGSILPEGKKKCLSGNILLEGKKLMFIRKYTSEVTLVVKIAPFRKQITLDKS
jgi:hypothetical protein